MAWYSVATDIGTQSIADSNIHSMTMPGQSVSDAIAGRNQYEQDQLDLDTLEGLGNAMHSAEDEFAKGHRFKEYNGHVDGDHEFYDWFPYKGDVDSAICAAKWIIAHRRRMIAGP